MFPIGSKFYDWMYSSQPEPHMNGRRVSHGRGKILGGSSSINGMIFQRGNPLDFQRWGADPGMSDWDYAHCLPYFKKMESCIAAKPNDEFRGKSGPLHMERGAVKNPLFGAFFKAVQEAGHPLTSDVNGFKQEGFAAFDRNVKRGRRFSAARAYLHPVKRRKNLTVQCRALATRLITEGKTVVGVEYTLPFGRRRTVRAKEVILCGGAFNSPQLLQVSGIGNEDDLRKVGITPVHHLPGVGENLHDHLEIYFQVKSKEPVTLYSKLNWFSKGLIGAEWMFFKTGLGATNHFESCGFIRSAAGVEYPDIQYHFLPAAMRYDGKAAFPGHGFQVHVGPMRAKSRGFVRVRSKEARQAPQILFNYLTHPDDMPEWRRAVRLTRELFQQPAMQRYAAEEIQPGPKVNSDAEIDAFIREHCESAYHPCGTCKMGAANDPTAVVDPECRVIGIDALRVADSSIMPQVTNGNLNGPTIMIGEKASDHILGKQPLAPSNQEPWINPDWQVSQR